MNIKHEFDEKYQNTAQFLTDFPVGKKFKWIDGHTWKVVGYITDIELKKKEYTHLIVIKCWNEYRKKWERGVLDLFEFYYVLDIAKQKK